MSCNKLQDGCCTDPRTPWARDLLIADTICAGCEHYDGPARGLGDRVAAVTRATGIAAAARVVSRVTGKPCGCSQRRAKLNAAFPTSCPQAESPKPS
jgi:hypothetical protein